MKQQQFEETNLKFWEQFLFQLNNSSSKNTQSNSKWDANEFAQNYRKLCHHLSLAKERKYSEQLVTHLTKITNQGHQKLYRGKGISLMNLISGLFIVFPQSLRQQAFWFWTSTAICLVPAIIVYLSVIIFPDSIYLFVNPIQVSDIEQMYQPSAHVVGEFRDSESNLEMFAHYINNNISIDFRIYASGLTFGVLTIFFLLLNSILFGALSAHMQNEQLHETFFGFVSGHAAFELIAMIIAGAAGLQLAAALIAPKQHTRFKALELSAKKTFPLIYGAAFMTLIAAFIEAFWSSGNIVSFENKLAFGALMFVLVVAYLSLAGRKK
ncbi:MAG: stage II sporulation protein M [Saccharospirillaceae bacterium]|nr:stage II sporulation protein M [Pseudomonadales bacterium]NRB78862.1 stage II sporulation protein M [Saccharospirillaceae bacterium]